MSTSRRVACETYCVLLFLKAGCQEQKNDGLGHQASPEAFYAKTKTWLCSSECG